MEFARNARVIYLLVYVLLSICVPLNHIAGAAFVVDLNERQIQDTNSLLIPEATTIAPILTTIVPQLTTTANLILIPTTTSVLLAPIVTFTPVSSRTTIPTTTPAKVVVRSATPATTTLGTDDFRGPPPEASYVIIIVVFIGTFVLVLAGLIFFSWLDVRHLRKDWKSTILIAQTGDPDDLFGSIHSNSSSDSVDKVDKDAADGYLYTPKPRTKMDIQSPMETLQIMREEFDVDDVSDVDGQIQLGGDTLSRQKSRIVKIVPDTTSQPSASTTPYPYQSVNTAFEIPKRSSSNNMMPPWQRTMNRKSIVIADNPEEPQTSNRKSTVSNDSSRKSQTILGYYFGTYTASESDYSSDSKLQINFRKSQNRFSQIFNDIFARRESELSGKAPPIPITVTTPKPTIKTAMSPPKDDIGLPRANSLKEYRSQHSPPVSPTKLSPNSTLERTPTTTKPKMLESPQSTLDRSLTAKSIDKIRTNSIKRANTASAIHHTRSESKLSGRSGYYPQPSSKTSVENLSLNRSIYPPPQSLPSSNAEHPSLQRVLTIDRINTPTTPSKTHFLSTAQSSSDTYVDLSGINNDMNTIKRQGSGSKASVSSARRKNI